MQVAVQVGSSMASFDADGAIPKGMEVRLLIGHSKLEDSTHSAGRSDAVAHSEAPFARPDRLHVRVVASVQLAKQLHELVMMGLLPA